jgi:hypothetical protein
MADSKYIGRVAFDDDTTLADDAITPGSSGLLIFGKNVGQALRVIEVFLGTGSTLTPAGSQYLAGTGAGTAEWTAVTSFPQRHDVVWQFLGTVTSPVTHGTPWRVEHSGTLLSIRLVLATVAATGAALTVDLLKNGNSVLSTKPSITVGQQINTNAPVFTSTAVAADDLLKPMILTGSDGVNLQVTLKYQDN